MSITVPIKWVKGNIFFVGAQKMVVELRRGELQVRVNGIHQSFQDFMIANENYF